MGLERPDGDRGVLLLGDFLWGKSLRARFAGGRGRFDLFLFGRCRYPAPHLLLAWSAAPGDLGGLGAFLQRWTDWPLLERHAELSALNNWARRGPWISAEHHTVVAHEFVHRARSFRR